MPFALLYELCPTVAEQETRCITVMPNSPFGIPYGDYHFAEMFCNEEGCDCRRVFFMVLSPVDKTVLAIIAWGWEGPEFYKRWMGDDDPVMIREMQGPNLNLGSAQSEYAEALLKLAQQFLLNDPAYVDRVKRHYALFRSIVDAPRKQGPKKEVPKTRRKRWRRK